MNMKSQSFAAQVSGQVRASSPGNSGFPNIYAGTNGGLVTSTGTRHLSAAPFNSIVHRHGSMPNVRFISKYFRKYILVKRPNNQFQYVFMFTWYMMSMEQVKFFSGNYLPWILNPFYKKGILTTIMLKYFSMARASKNNQR